MLDGSGHRGKNWDNYSSIINTLYFKKENDFRNLSKPKFANVSLGMSMWHKCYQLDIREMLEVSINIISF